MKILCIGDIVSRIGRDMLFKYVDDMKYQKGIDLVINGNLPNGAGLSSSASLEMLIVKILETFFSLNISKVDAALIGKEVENTYIGVNSGIMDQFAISLGEKDKAILLDCNSLYYEYVPLNLGDNSIIIMNTNKRRELADSKYNERRSECEAALAELQQVIGIESLGDLSEEQVETYKSAIKDPVRVKRARHAVYENQRTIKAVAALKANDITEIGKLMNASHVSLRDDYEVSGIELDTLVEEAWKVDGVIGSRMTGAGFGGCTVSIVKDEAIDTFIEQVGKAYKEKIGYAADFYVVEIGDGPQTLQEIKIRRE